MIQPIADAWRAAYLHRVEVEQKRGNEQTPTSLEVLTHLRRRWSGFAEISQTDVRETCARLGLAITDSVVTRRPPPDRAKAGWPE